MEKNLLSQFVEASLTSLAESFNAQVGNRGFNSARAAHDHALIDELERRGVDVSALSDGHAISCAHHIATVETNMKRVIQGYLHIIIYYRSQHPPSALGECGLEINLVSGVNL